MKPIIKINLRFDKQRAEFTSNQAFFFGVFQNPRHNKNKSKIVKFYFLHSQKTPLKEPRRAGENFKNVLHFL